MLILLLIATAGVVLAEPSMYLQKPKDNSIFTLPKGRTSIDVPLQFQIFDGTDYLGSACLELMELTTNKIFMKQTCVKFENDNLIVQNVPVGKYDLAVHIANSNEEQVSNSMVHSIFQVVSFEHSLPAIKFSEQTAIFPVSFTTDTADVVLDYTIFPTSDESHTICINIVTEAGAVVVEQSCLSSSDRSFTVSNMNMGSYIVKLTLQDTATGELYPSTSVTCKVHVKRLQECLSAIVIPVAKYEAAVETDTGHAKDVAIEFSLIGESLRCLRDVELCVQVVKFNQSSALLAEDEDTEQSASAPPQEVIALTCMEASRHAVGLSGLTEGLHRVVLTARELRGGKTVLSALEQAVAVDVRPYEELVPSYRWQPLHAWHTIPYGLETRLPLDGGVAHNKEAKIPDPWRLQLSMPAPQCEYFLRMDVSRDTLISDIEAAAALKCDNKLAATCFQLLGDNHVLSQPEGALAQATVESTGLFLKKASLVIKPECLQQ